MTEQEKTNRILALTNLIALELPGEEYKSVRTKAAAELEKLLDS